ncbi:STAS domain-containing protein [Actinacidiphila rubida]|uniref:STAS domain-containing protein n=1 Tax=Actinacidiphila rubida TaxID=310780 RepID=UPI0008497869|nr:STAS domain-containing protein [Actinacidiphila rubida]
MDIRYARLEVVVFGDIDMHTAPGLEAALRACVDAGSRDVEVDLDRVSFMDSSIVNLLIRTSAYVTQQQGRLNVRCTERAGRRIFQLTGTQQLLDVRETAAGRGFSLRADRCFYDCVAASLRPGAGHLSSLDPTGSAAP